MEFAIVDIETTGGHSSGNSITEVSIHVHDGQKVIERFETLIKPDSHIPNYITGLTGITDDMVKDAPRFSEVSEQIFDILKNRVFIAHSVNFDYSFIKRELQLTSFELNCKKLCTVRLSRKIFPGFVSYSLGKLCAQLDIPLKNRHRAGGDAEATVILFEQLLKKDGETVVKSLNRGSKEQALPPNLPKEQFNRLPDTPGVYYFHNQKGKIVYVGKAVNIRKRVSSHFSNNSPNKQKQDFMRHIHAITFQECGNELMSLILESHEIKRLWPEFNRAQKRFEAIMGIVCYLDQTGYKRLAVVNVRKGLQPIVTFNTMLDGLSVIKKATEEFELCLRLSGIVTDENVCKKGNCVCTKRDTKSLNAYNKRTDKAIASFMSNDSFYIMEEGRNENEIALVVVEKGFFTRMGFLNADELTEPLSDQAISRLSLYKNNFNIRNIIATYCARYAERVVSLNDSDRINTAERRQLHPINTFTFSDNSDQDKRAMLF